MTCEDERCWAHECCPCLDCSDGCDPEAGCPEFCEDCEFTEEDE